MECDVPAALARPVQLILRDRYGTDIDVLDVMGPTSRAKASPSSPGMKGSATPPAHK